MTLAKYSLVLFYTILATFIYWYLYGKPMIGIDDANIYFIYVKNFVEGNGFVYSDGGERVEGFTSILWVLLISPLYWLGQNFEVAIQFLNVIIISVVLFASINFVNRITESKTFFSTPSLLFLILITVIPGYFDWSLLTLMETGLWSFLLTIIAILLCTGAFTSRRYIQLAFLLSLLLLTRPESLIWIVVFLSLTFLRVYIQQENFYYTLKTMIWPIISVVFTVASLTVFRLLYFGYPLPNTYYAKVSTNVFYNLSEGVRYFLFCAIQSPLILLIIVACIISFILIALKILKSIKEKKLSDLNQGVQVQFILSIITLISILIPIYVGGDHFSLLRFYQPFMLIYFFLLFNISFWKQYVSVNINLQLNLFAKILLLILLAPFFYLLTDSPLHTFLKTGSPLGWEFRLAELGIEEGKLMNEFFAQMDQLPSVGVSAAGGFGYAYSGKVIDLMGLNNITMAHALKEKVGIKNHAAFDKATFYSQKPEVFHGYKKISGFVKSPNDTTILENDPGFADMYVFRLYKKIFTDREFRLNYHPVVVSHPASSLYLRSYFSTEFIRKLQSHGYYVYFIKRKDSI